VFKVAGLILMSLFITTTSLVLVSRPTGSHLNPFSTYADVLPGQPRENAEAFGFECASYADGYDDRELCSLHPLTGSFSRINLVVTDDGTIESVFFMPRKYALKVGDVVLVLGVSHMTLPDPLYRRSDTSSHGYGIRYAGRFSFIRPVLYIALW
jgi:hypothetical protein